MALNATCWLGSSGASLRLQSARGRLPAARRAMTSGSGSPPRGGGGCTSRDEWAARSSPANGRARPMCGRFVQRDTWDDIQDLYDLPDGPAPNLQAHYNVAPTDPVNVVRAAAGGQAELVSMRWGL